MNAHPSTMTCPDRGSDGTGSARVAYVVCTFETGGLERCVARLCNHLDPDRFRPMVVCLSRNGAAAGWIERDDVPIVELRKRDGNDLLLVRRLARALKEHRVDVVHSHNWGTLVETSLARRWAGVPVHVHSEHGQGLHEGLHGLKRRLRSWATRFALNCADAVTVCAESVRPIVHGRSGFPRSRMQFIPNGVEKFIPPDAPEGAERIRRRLGLGDGAIIVGSVGRLAPVKDFATLIDAIGIVARHGHDIHLVLVGDGSERNRLSACARAAGIVSHVHFVGRQKNVGDWLTMFDVYVNSSLSEAMSLGILEAMAAGLPVVATDVGDNASLVTGSWPCGIIVPPANPNSLAEAIGSLASDCEQRARLGDNARSSFLSTYSVGRMTARYSELYSGLLDGAGSRA